MMVLKYQFSRFDDCAAFGCFVREPVVRKDSGEPRMEQEKIEVQICARAYRHAEQVVCAVPVADCQHRAAFGIADAFQNQVVPLVRRRPVVRHLDDYWRGRHQRARVPCPDASAARWQFEMVKASQAMAGGVVLVKAEDVLHGFR